MNLGAGSRLFPATGTKVAPGYLGVKGLVQRILGLVSRSKELGGAGIR